MNIIETNGSIDWQMFGTAVKNARRERSLNEEQFAEVLNRTAGETVFTDKQIARIEAGKLVPNVSQLVAFDKLTGRDKRVAEMLCDMANSLLAPTPKAAQIPVQTYIESGNPAIA